MSAPDGIGSVVFRMPGRAPWAAFGPDRAGGSGAAWYSASIARASSFDTMPVLAYIPATF